MLHCVVRQTFSHANVTPDLQDLPMSRGFMLLTNAHYDMENVADMVVYDVVGVVSDFCWNLRGCVVRWKQ